MEFRIDREPVAEFVDRQGAVVKAAPIPKLLATSWSFASGARM